MDSYRHLSEKYDFLMDDVQNEKWAEYLFELLNGINVKTASRIFEVACGTGRITLPMARYGYDITALDISEEMLNKAQEKIRKSGLSVRFLSGDMMNFILSKPIDAILCACDGVNYLLNDNDVYRFFKTCWQNLNPGGVLLFDISSYNKLIKTLGNNLFYDDREDLTCLWQNKLSGDLVHMELTLFVRKNHLYQRMDEEHIQRAYKINKIKQILHDTGFCGTECYNFFTRDEATEDNERIQFLTVKEQ